MKRLEKKATGEEKKNNLALGKNIHTWVRPPILYFEVANMGALLCVVVCVYVV